MEMEQLFMMTYFGILLDKKSKYWKIYLYTYVSWMYYIDSIYSKLSYQLFWISRFAGHQNNFLLKII